MNTWLVRLVKLKMIYANGGAYIPDSIVGGVVAGFVLINQWWPIAFMIIARISAGILAVRLNIIQKESELNITWMNPYLDGKLKTSRRTVTIKKKH